MDPELNKMARNVGYVLNKLGGSTLHVQLKRAAQHEVEKSTVLSSTLKEDVIKAFKTSGWEKLLRNDVFTYLSSVNGSMDNRDQIPYECQKEPLMYMRKAQANWEKRILKSLNSMCTDLSIPLARKRPADEHRDLLHKWNEMGTDEPDLSHFRPVYAPKDFLEVITSLRNPNYASLTGCEIEDSLEHIEGHLGLIQVPLDIPSTAQLQKTFSEFGPGIGHTGLDDSVDVQYETFQVERNKLAKRVLDENRSDLGQYFCCKGCPSGNRADLWQLSLGVTISHLDVLKYEQLKGYVLQHDLLVDSLIYKDVKLTSVNDDYYFVFEDYLYQVLLVFSRDTAVLEHFNYSSATPPKSFIRVLPGTDSTECNSQENVDEVKTEISDIKKETTKSWHDHKLSNLKPNMIVNAGKLGQDEYSVVYPPNGVIPFHGFSMLVTPLCYLYSDPITLYFIFRRLYMKHFHRLHAISSHPQGIISLCFLFETQFQNLHPTLFRHLQEMGCQPLKIAFKWLVRAFSGYLSTDQLLLLWDRIIGYDSLHLLPMLAIAIFLFRQSNLLQITSPSYVEASLSDLSTVQVIPLLQLVLFPR